MRVELLHATPLGVCSTAIRTCWSSHDKSDSESLEKIGERDFELIDRVGNKFKHGSTLEHIVLQYRISGVSRALLQELARHRIASLSVKSTRYTLKELKSEECFEADTKMKHGECWYDDETRDRAGKYIVFTGDLRVDNRSVLALEQLRQVLVDGVSNDIAKYCLPESYKTELVYTINARSLQNLLSLRTSKSALWEIRELACQMFSVLPDEYRSLLVGSAARCAS